MVRSFEYISIWCTEYFILYFINIPSFFSKCCVKALIPKNNIFEYNLLIISKVGNVMFAVVSDEHHSPWILRKLINALVFHSELYKYLLLIHLDEYKTLKCMYLAPHIYKGSSPTIRGKMGIFSLNILLSTTLQDLTKM